MNNSNKTVEQIKSQNIEIINQILRINNNEITQSIIGAFKKYCLPSNSVTDTDLMCIIFETLSNLFENIDFKKTSVNENYLDKQVKTIGELLSIGNFPQLLQQNITTDLSTIFPKIMSNNMMSLASDGVYSSAVDAIKKKHRHLYVEMLELITKITNATNPQMATNHFSEDRIKFWFDDLLPLLFDSDELIQNNAMMAIDALIPHLDTLNFQDHPNWLASKSMIVDNYTILIDKLRAAENPVWYQIWNLLLRILNKEILRGSAVLNKFLAIVEPGFRCEVMRIRAESFLCWKVLVEIFAKNHSILSAKRIKLICIPMKSTNSKTTDIVYNKFQVWWHLISQISTQIEEYYTMVLEPFFVFCFGPAVSDNPPTSNSATDSSFSVLMPLAITSIIQLIGQPNDEAIHIMTEHKLQKLEKPLLTKIFFAKISNTIINSAFEATIRSSKSEKQCSELLSCLWWNLFQQLSELPSKQYFNLIIGKINELIEQVEGKQLLDLTVNIIYILGAKSNIFPISVTKKDDITEINIVFESIHKITMLLFNPTLSLTSDNVDNIISKIYHLDIYHSCKYYDFLLKNLFQFIIEPENENLDDEKHNLNIKLKIWTILSAQLTDYLKLNVRRQCEIEYYYKYLHWPIKKFNDNEQFQQVKPYWTKLAKSIFLSCGNEESFMDECIFIIKSTKHRSDLVGELFNFVGTNFQNDKVMPKKMFQMIDIVLNTPSVVLKDLNPIATAVNSYTSKLDGVQLLIIYSCLKNVMDAFEKEAKTLRVDRSIVNGFKSIIAQHMRNKKTQSLVLQCKDEKIKKELLNYAKDEYVVVAKPWTFDPDKLTEHQKEKMKEKRLDIPSMMCNNDLSQSQESVSLKAWTPKKIVIPQSSDNENTIVIDVGDQGDTNNIDNLNIPKQPSENVQESLEIVEECVQAAATSKSSRNRLSTEERKQMKIQNELKKITMDIVDAQEFQEIKPRTRGKRLNFETVTTPRSKRQSVDSLNRDVVSSKSISTTPRLDRITRRKSIKEEEEVKLKTTYDKVDDNFDETIEASQQEESVFMPRSAVKRGVTASNKTFSNEVVAMAPTQSKSIKKRNSLNLEMASSEDTAHIKTSLGLDDKIKKFNVANEKLKISEMDTLPITDSLKLLSNAPIANEEEAMKMSIEMNVTNEKIANMSTEFNTIDVTLTTELESNTQYTACDVEIEPNVIRRNKSKSICKMESISNTELEKSSKKETQQNTDLEKMLELNTDNLSLMDMDTEIVDIPLQFNKSTTENETMTQIELEHPVAELETQPNTSSEMEHLNRTSILESSAKISDSSLNTDELSSQTTNNVKADQSKSLILIENKCNIETSPVGKNVNEKNNELLNSTINISPILDNAEAVIRTNLSSVKNDSTILKIKSSFKTTTDILTPTNKSSTCRITSSTPLTSNSPSTSTAKRLKMQAYVGRGAQILNILNNRKHSPAPAAASESGTIANPLIATSSILEMIKLPYDEANKNDAPPTSPELPTYEELIENNKELLRFSKVLPSPCASPSFSILKRKICDNTIDEIESPASKRKRVSFHDPPVSVTKEYIRHHDENPIRWQANRGLMSPGIAATATANISKSNNSPLLSASKISLKRQSRADSMVEIAKFVKSQAQPLKISSDSSVMTNDLHLNNGPIPEEYFELSPPSEKTDLETDSPDKATILGFFVENFTPEDILNKMIECNDNATSSLINKLSSMMLTDKKMQSNVLEQLCENHPQDYLQHAIVENLGSVICDRLSPNIIVDYISDKAKTNADIKDSLFEKIGHHLSASPADNELLRHLLCQLFKNVNNESLLVILNIMTSLLIDRNKQ